MVEMMPHVQTSGRIWNIVVLSTIWTVVTSTSAQRTPPGFISIDCGSANQHKDSVTNLTWETDGKHMLSGMNGVVPNPPDSGTINYEALRTFRYFRDPQKKYCYELHMATGNISVLIRAVFLHGNSPELILPITFKVYVNANLWNSVQYSKNESEDFLNTPKVIEGIFYAPENVSYVCLVPDHGVPFISSLELRQLDPEGVMYSLSNRQAQFLSTLFRYNLGVSDGSILRYPEDTYDRLWNSSAYFLPSPFSSQKEKADTNSSLNNVPPTVMMDAYVLLPGWLGLVSYLTLPLATAGGYVHAIFYCQTVNDNEGVNMFISLNDEETKPLNITDIPVMQTLPHIGLLTNTIGIEVGSLTSSGAILNAMEIYEENIFDSFTTYAGDVSLISFLKTTFNLSHWQGDPCLPVPFDWITCVDNYVWHGTNEQSIESLRLSKLNDSARLRNSASLIVINTLSSMTSLTITDSHVDDFTFRFLIENFTASAEFFEHLDLSHNDITTFPSLTSWSTRSWGPILLFDFIDLSHNYFKGEVLSFSTFYTPDPYTSLTRLNLSYNSFTSLPKIWGNSSHGLFNLTVLDLSHNAISSSISLLNELLMRNPSLEEIHLSNNILMGVFPSDLYFSKKNLPNLRSVNVNQNNITGSLNLTTWYHQLEQAMKNFSSPLGGQLYSFVNNDISDIIPSADIFQPAVEFLMRNNSLFKQSGVLLSGNPYCKNAKSLAQRYLCRSTVNDPVYEIQKKKVNIILIVFTTLGGIVFLLLSSIIFIVIWRLWRQLSITSKLLREVQQELTNRKVQPPFYSYHDLRVATKNFHEDNKLGSGAFGAVYKGILSDGSVVAVKRLFNSDKAQVLNEFLSEVALISGIKHKHLIQLKGCCIKDEERILIYEFAANGNLAEALWGKYKTPILDWTHRLNVAVGVARGLSYLHEELQPRIVHRDIKAVNVLLDENFNAKIADFGLAKPFEEEETQAQFTAIAGTRGYFAPEYVLEGHLTVKADVFSFGILLLEILAGRKCIDSTLPSDLVYIKTWAEDMKKSKTLLELLQPGLRDTAPEPEFIMIVNIALSCIRTDPKFRPTMSQVVIMLLENLEAQNFWKENRSKDEGVDLNFDSFQEGTSVSMSRGMISFGRTRSGIRYEDSEHVPFVGSQSFPRYR